MLLLTWVCIFLLPSQIICDLTQDPADFENAGSSLQFTSDGRECCPCPKSGSADESALPDGGARDSLPDPSAPQAVVDKASGSTDGCLCKPRDSDSAASISDERYSETQHPIVRNADENEDKTLLHPEVELASSVLETLRDATEEEYRDALAREVAKNAAEPINVFNDSEGNKTPINSKPESITIIINSTNPINDADVERLESHTQEIRCASSSLKEVNEDTVGLPSEAAKSYVKLDKPNTIKEFLDSMPKFQVIGDEIKLKPLKELLQDIHLNKANNQLGRSEQAANQNDKVLAGNIVENAENSEPGEASTNNITLSNLLKTTEGDIKLKPLKQLLQDLRANKKDQTGKADVVESPDSKIEASTVDENVKIVSSKINLPTLFTKTEEGIQLKPLKEFLQDFHSKGNNENQDENMTECQDNKVSGSNVDNNTFEKKSATPKLNLPSFLKTNENGIQLKPLKELLQELQPNTNKKTMLVHFEKSSGQNLNHDNTVAASNFKENIENDAFTTKIDPMKIKLPSLLKTSEGGNKLKPLRELFQDLLPISMNKVDPQKEIKVQDNGITATDILKNVDCKTPEKEIIELTKTLSDTIPTVETTLFHDPVDKPSIARKEGTPSSIDPEKEFNNKSSQNFDAKIDFTKHDTSDSGKNTESEITRQVKDPKAYSIDEPQQAAFNNDCVLDNNNLSNKEETAEMDNEDDLTINDSSQLDDAIAVFDTSFIGKEANQESFELSLSDDSQSNPKIKSDEDVQYTELELGNEDLNTVISKENDDIESDYEDQMTDIASVEEKNDENKQTDMDTEPSDPASKELGFVDKENNISDKEGIENDQNDNFNLESNVRDKNFITSEKTTKIMNEIENEKEVKDSTSSADLQNISDSLLIKGLKEDKISPTECGKDDNMSKNEITVDRNDTLQLKDKSWKSFEGLPHVSKVADNNDNIDISQIKNDVNVNNITEVEKKEDTQVTRLIENSDVVDPNQNVNISNDSEKNDVITCLERSDNKGPDSEPQDNTVMTADASDTIRSIIAPPNPLFRNLGKQNNKSSLRNNLIVQSESLLDDIKKSLKLKPLTSSNNLASAKIALPSIEEIRFKINDALGLPSLLKPIATQSPTSNIFSKGSNFLSDTFNLEAKPKIELPRVEISKVELPKLKLPRIELPKQEIPRLILPQLEFPKIELPQLELPRFELPKSELRKLDLPALLGSTKTVNLFEESLEKPISNLNLDIFQYKSPLLKQSNLLKSDSHERLHNLNSYRLNIPLKQPILVKPVAVKSAIRNKEGFMGATLALKPESVSEKKLFDKIYVSSMKTTKTKTQKVSRDQMNVNKMKAQESLLTTTKPLYAGIKNKLQVNPKTVKVPKLQPKLPETGGLKSSFVGNQDFISKKLDSFRNSQVGKNNSHNLFMSPLKTIIPANDEDLLAFKSLKSVKSGNDDNLSRIQENFARNLQNNLENLRLGAISRKNNKNSDNSKAREDLLKSTITIKINDDKKSKNVKSSAGRPLKTNNLPFGNLRMLPSASNDQIDRVPGTTEEKRESSAFGIPRIEPQNGQRNSVNNDQNLQEARSNDKVMDTDNNKVYGENLIQTLKAILGKLNSINNNVHNMNTREQKLYSNLLRNKPSALSPRESNNMQILGKISKPTLRIPQTVERGDLGQSDGIAESTSLRETNSNHNTATKILPKTRESSTPKALIPTTSSTLLESTLLEKLKEALDATRSKIMESSSSKTIISNRANQKARNSDMDNAASDNIESPLVTEKAMKENVNYQCRISCSRD